MKRWFWILGALALTACAAPGLPDASPAEPASTGRLGDIAADDSPGPTPLPDYGPAPELHNAVWLNVDAPLQLADLRGKVVLIDFWTFG